MNRTKRRYLLIIALLLLQSCYSINTNYTLNKLKYGLTKNEIINNVFLSHPAEKKVIDNNKEIYVYYIHSSVFELIFNAERFPYIGFYPLNRTGKEYWLLIDKEKGLIRSAYAKEWGVVGK